MLQGGWPRLRLYAARGRPGLRRYAAPSPSAPQPPSAPKWRPIVAGALVGAVLGTGLLVMTTPPPRPPSPRGACEIRAPPSPSGSAGSTLDQHLRSADIVVFSTPWCPYCKEAVAALKQHGLEPKVVMVEGGLVDELIAHTNCTSVPQVFVRGSFVGGCYDGGLGGVVPLLRSGQLQAMLK
eukprot:EG_transcript_24560